MNKLRESINKAVENNVLQVVMIVVFLIPLIATIGQYVSSNFIFEKSSVELLYWPCYEKSFKIYIPVWVTFGVMGLSYVYGIYYMCRRKTFVKVVLISFISLFLAQGLGNIINYFIGLKEMQHVNSMDLSGLVNKMILAEWYNPLWEEVFFTGIPLVLYTVLTKSKSEKIKNIGKVIYFIVPSVICSLYHIPNHGPARILDTFLIHVVFEYIALRFSFFANLVMHYIFDAMIVLSVYKFNSVSYDEIKWLSDNSSLLSSAMSICIILFLGLLVSLIIKNCIKYKKSNIIKENN